MESDFWHKRWKEERIGFHRDATNPQLEKFFPTLALPEGAGIFVPLCGKTLDMHYLQKQGHPVVGVELSELAARQFFEESGLTYEKSQVGKLSLFQSEGISFYAGDFFDLEAEQLKGVRAVYDRAALIALPPEMREKYVQRLKTLLTSESKMLLLTLEYDQSITNGPPFSITDKMVRDFYAGSGSIEELNRREIIEEEDRFKEAGLTSLIEAVYKIQF